MKKIILTIITFLILFTPVVDAANYELKELIPAGIKTTIVTKNFSYRQFTYNEVDKTVHFETIKNISDESLPISISIALFDGNKRNLGILNYCAEGMHILDQSAEIPFSIQITDVNVPKEKSIEDIKYIAILEDNKTCKKENNFLYVDQKIEDVGVYHGGELPESTKLAVTVIGIIVVLLIILFLYQFLFTNKFNNMDGNDVRKLLREYKNDNARASTFGDDKHSELPEGISIINRSKTAEMADKEAEENEKSRRKENDLMDMYK